MKIWTSEHTFDHSWDVVTQAAWRKYPNPLNPSVVAVDIVDRNVTNDGRLLSHRLITTKWNVPSWAQPVFGSHKLAYASEHSVVDREKKIMKMMSRNISFCNELWLSEQLTYTEHPTKPGCTLLTQEAVVTIQGVPLSSHLESFIAGSISNNATKGRQAMEMVINVIKEEIGELKHSVDDIATGAKQVASCMEELVTLHAEKPAPPPPARGWFSWLRG